MEYIFILKYFKNNNNNKNIFLNMLWDKFYSVFLVEPFQWKVFLRKNIYKTLILKNTISNFVY